MMSMADRGSFPMKLRVVLLMWGVCLLISPGTAFAQDADAEDDVEAFYALSEDGEQLRRLFGVPGTSFGSPAVSPDGKLIAFDGWEVGKNTGAARIFVVAIDQSSFREVCTGNMPTWSADGKYLTMSRSGTNPSGVWMASADGDQLEHVDSGWGAQWAPDGKTIGYLQGSQIVLYDVETGETRTVFPAGEEPYRGVYWNMEFSPDSRRICFLGRNSDGTSDIAIVSLDDPEAEIKVIMKGQTVYPGFAWHPKGNRVCFTMGHPETGIFQVYEFDPDSDAPPFLMKGQDPGKRNREVCWMPDGSELVYVADPVPTAQSQK